MITCKSKRIEDELDALPLELMEVLDEFGHWSNAEGLPLPVITCIKRDDAENKSVGGALHSLHLEVNGQVNAVDLRNRHYSPDQLNAVNAWFNKRCADKAKWETVLHVHGTGPHCHIALRRH